MRAARRWWWGAGLVLGVTTVAVGAPMVTSGPFSLPGPGPMSSPLWSGPTPRRVAARVRVKTGQVEVQAQGDATPAAPTAPYQPVRTISAGGDLLLEGRWTGLQVALATAPDGNAVGFPADGTYGVRDLDDVTPDRRIGSVSVEAQGGAWTDAYVATEGGPRLFVVRAGGSRLWAAADPVPANHTPAQRYVFVDADDASFAALGGADPMTPDNAVKGVRIYSSMPSNVELDVFDAQPATSPYDGGSVVCTSRALEQGAPGTDTDYALVDGTVNLRVSFLNHCGAPLTVVYAVAGGPDLTETVAPSACGLVEGRLSKLLWVHQAVGRVTVTAAIVP
ncbi:MAG: hypothetical protein IT460_04520 [Planctomycetes bacterium]|nr:hypothetical protein [Planctomycetota bacterium]